MLILTSPQPTTPPRTPSHLHPKPIRCRLEPPRFRLGTTGSRLRPFHHQARPPRPCPYLTHLRSEPSRVPPPPLQLKRLRTPFRLIPIRVTGAHGPSELIVLLPAVQGRNLPPLFRPRLGLAGCRLRSIPLIHATGVLGPNNPAALFDVVPVSPPRPPNRLLSSTPPFPAPRTRLLGGLRQHAESRTLEMTAIPSSARTPAGTITPSSVWIPETTVIPFSAWILEMTAAALLSAWHQAMTGRNPERVAGPLPVLALGTEKTRTADVLAEMNSPILPPITGLSTLRMRRLATASPETVFHARADPIRRTATPVAGPPRVMISLGRMTETASFPTVGTAGEPVLSTVRERRFPADVLIRHLG